MMSDIDRNVGFGAAMTQAETAAIDAGLRSYMRRVYNYMMIGLAITGAAALGLYLLSVTGTVADASYVIRAGRVIPVPAGFVAQGRDILLTGIGYAVFVSPLKWAIIFAPLALVFGLSFGVERLRPATAQFLFWLYAAMVGLSLASIFLIYTHTSITRVFFITAASFGALSLWGYTTQRDLSGMGSFLIMGLFGIIIASLVNIFLASSALQFAISVIGVIVFVGLTAYDTQQIKEMYFENDDAQTAGKKAIMGALRLYLDFINLFMRLLQLFGSRRD